MSVDQAARHRQTLGIETLAVRAGGTELGDVTALDGDVDVAGIETSHALLRYHFGSLSGVLAAMLNAQRSRDNEALLEAAQQGTFDDFVVAIWRTYNRPEQLSRARGFFYVAGLAAYGSEDFREFVESIGDLTVMLSSLAEREGLDTKEARDVATVTVAAIRGLLLQEVLTPGTCSEDAVALILRMREG
ncbi:TetR/AcrR family transcriptional regulator [Streptomyces niveus]|uniref:TetR/AcrR family transcriptional regulator n=1 Tax=Streptomyces niveus TaxID=193462 RepID=UPI0036DC86B3